MNPCDGWGHAVEALDCAVLVPPADIRHSDRGIGNPDYQLTTIRVGESHKRSLNVRAGSLFRLADQDTWSSALLTSAAASSFEMTFVGIDVDRIGSRRTFMKTLVASGTLALRTAWARPGAAV